MKYNEYDIENFLADELFVKWVKTDSKKADHFWQSWISEHPEKLPAVRKAREILLNTQVQKRPSPSKKDYNDVLEGILKSTRSPSCHTVNRYTDTNRDKLRYAVAASIVLMLLSAWFFQANFRGVDTGKLAESPPTLTRKVANGHKSTLRLADGTVVKLNAGAEINFPEYFDPTGNREVTLAGEAFFEVAHNPEQPFIIHCNGVSTKVLGTSFNISAKPDRVNVAVVTGKVKVCAANAGTAADMVFLEKGEQVHYESTTRSFIKTRADVSAVTSWTRGIIYFKEANFTEIETRLEEWYGVEINTRLVPKARFSGRFKNKSLEEVLDGLSYTFNFQYKLEGKSVIIF